MDERARFEGLLLVIEELVDANLSTPILVEGQRDVAALRALGCAGDVLPLHNGRTVWTLAEDLSRRGPRVILLTDWDKKGNRLRADFATALAANGVRADATFHDRLQEALSMKIKDVESLASYVENGVARFLKR